MRNHKKQVQTFLAVSLVKYRHEKGVSQEKMAENLLISPRGYGDLERNKYCMSLMVFICFIMIMTPEERLQLFDDLQHIVMKTAPSLISEYL